MIQHPRLKTVLGLSIFILLMGVYLFFYRGHPLNVDEISLFDSVNSFVHRGAFTRTIEYHRAVEIDVNEMPQIQALYEPMQIISASPFLWISQRIPEIGQFQTVLLLNVFVTALTGVSVYAIALKLGYSLPVSWSAALIFGVATIALPYSRFLFREPLTGFFTLWAFFMAIQVREQATLRRMIFLTLSIAGMLLTKQAGFLFLPGIFLCLLPYKPALLRKLIPGFLALIALLVVFVVALSILQPDFGDDRYSLQRWLNPNNWQWAYSLESFLGYQISPARSFWLYSPVLLLGLWGMVKLVRREKSILPVGIIFALLFSSAAYGALRLGTHWYGGPSWGPRYMVPLIPVWMLLIMPVLRDFTRYSRPLKLLIAFVVIISAGMQLLGVAIPFSDFYFANPTIPVAWSAENWSWENAHIAYNLRFLRLDQLDVAWRFANPTYAAPLLALVMIGVGGVSGVYLLRERVVRRGGVMAMGGAVILLTLLTISVALISLQRDTRYILHRPDVYDLIERLNQEIQPEDVVLINNSDFTLMLMFMNWFKASPSYLTLAEQVEAEPFTRHAVDWATRTFERVWLVSKQARTAPVEDRPIEYNLATFHYPIMEIEQSPEARALLFTTGIHVEDTVLIEDVPESSGELSLVSATIPATAYAGSTYPVTLRWMLSAPVERELCVSLQLLEPNGNTLTQHDSMPQGNFGFTSKWETGTVYEDHHGLAIPSVSGTYQLQTVTYACQGEVLDILPIQRVEIQQR